MSKQLYFLMLASVDAWLRQETDQADPDNPCADLANITAQAGQFKNTSARSANDATFAAALLKLLLIYAWSCAKYRVDLLVKTRNGVQIQKARFLTHHPDETLGIRAFPEIIGQFWDTDTLCQMICLSTLPPTGAGWR